jgi:hypothetical protein
MICCSQSYFKRISIIQIVSGFSFLYRKEREDFGTKLKEDQTHPVPLSVSRSYTPLLIIYYDTTVYPIRKVQA